ncbi:MAG: acyl-CoA carboxylase subunit beta [Nitrososphaerota archaeon]|nr:acyl-CoA carboxylase subunit beta [Nitrososphaerota archaeon]
MITAPNESVAERLERITNLAEQGGGVVKIEEQHRKGKKTARERLRMLLDPDSFVEIDKLVVSRSEDAGSKYYSEGVVTGYGTVDGRTVFVFAHDFTVQGGSLGEMVGKKINKIMDLALKAGAPIIGLNDSGGARIQEGVQSLSAYSDIFFRNAIASGVVPQISAILGPCAGGAVYSPTMTDFVLMVEKTSKMFVTGPDIVKEALGEETTFEDLGGAWVHATKSGVAHFVTSSEDECFDTIRKLLSFLPANNSEVPPKAETTDNIERIDPSLDDVVPRDSNKPYDMKRVVTTVLDYQDFFEVHPHWAKNIIVGFGRLDGGTVGIVANQPLHLAGSLDIDSSNKAARFIRFCDAFNIPIITFVDVPGYMPGMEQETGGLIRHGSKLLYAYCEATVPKITTVVRKAYGGAYCAMGSKNTRADLNFAWPSAEFAVMGPDGAAKILYRKELDKSPDAATRKMIVKDYALKHSNPFLAAERGIIDAVIKPRETRKELIRSLRMLSSKHESRPTRKHGNIQL